MEYETFEQIPEEATYVTPFDELMQRLASEEPPQSQEPNALTNSVAEPESLTTADHPVQQTSQAEDSTTQQSTSRTLPGMLICIAGVLVGLASIGAGIWAFRYSQDQTSQRTQDRVALQNAKETLNEFKGTLEKYDRDLAQTLAEQKKSQAKLLNLSNQVEQLNEQKVNLAKENKNLQDAKNSLESTTQKQEMAIAKLKAITTFDPKQRTSEEILQRGQTELAAGNLQKARDIFELDPGRGPISKPLLVARANIRWKIYLREKTLVDQPLDQNDEQVNAVMKTLAQIDTPDSLYLRAQIEEECGNYQKAFKLYSQGKKTFPKNSRQFLAGMQRLQGRLTTTMLENRKTSPKSSEIIQAEYVLYQDPAKGRKADGTKAIEEAGYFYWNAVEAARKHDYKQAIQLLTTAKTLHEKRRKLLPQHRLNPTSDDPEQIFQRSCDQLIVYWKMREYLKGKGLTVPANVAGGVAEHVKLLNKLSTNGGAFLKEFGKNLLPNVKAPTKKQVLAKVQELQTNAAAAAKNWKDVSGELNRTKKELKKVKAVALTAKEREKKAIVDLLTTSKKLEAASDELTAIQKELKNAKLLDKKKTQILPALQTLLKDRKQLTVLNNKVKNAVQDALKAKGLAAVEAKRAEAQAKIALSEKRKAEAAEKTLRDQTKALKSTQQEAREAKKALETIAEKLGCPPTPGAILKKLNQARPKLPKTDSSSLLAAGMEQLQLGRLERARDILDTTPKEKAPSQDLHAWRARIRWLIYQQQQAKADKNSQYNDKEVQNVLTRLKKVNTPQALLWRAQIAEETGKTDQAKKLYAQGIKQYPKGASVFRVSLERVQSRPPELSHREDRPTSLIVPLFEHLTTLFVTTTLHWDGLQTQNDTHNDHRPSALPAPTTINVSQLLDDNLRRVIEEAKAQMPRATEAGGVFYEALGLARRGQYDEAIGKLQDARKLHAKQRKTFPSRNLNPQTDPQAEIFPRCCLQIEVYWRTRQLLQKANYRLPDLNNSVETQLEPFRKLLADLKSSQDLVAALRKHGKGGPFQQDGKSLATLKSVLRQCKENELTLALIAQRLQTTTDRNQLLGAIANLNGSMSACALSLHDEIMVELCRAGWRFPRNVSASAAVQVLIQDWQKRGALLQQHRPGCWETLTQHDTVLQKAYQATLASREAKAALTDALAAKAAAELKTKTVLTQLAKTTQESKIQIAALCDTLKVANQKIDLAIQKQNEAQLARQEAEDARDQAKAAHQLAEQQNAKLQREYQEARQEQERLQETIVRIAGKLKSSPDRANLLRTADQLLQNPTAEELLPTWGIILRDPDQIELADRALQDATTVLARSNDTETNPVDLAWAQYVKALALRNTGYCQEARATLASLLQTQQSTLPTNLQTLATICLRQIDSVADYYERRGEELKRKGALEKSLWLLDRGIAELPNAGRLYALRSLVHLENAKLNKVGTLEMSREKAQKDASVAIAKGARDVGNYAAGRVAEDQQQWEAARVHFLEALRAHAQEDQAKQRFRLALARVLLVRSDLLLN
ncbi:MAG: hypothetical protein ACFCD0_19480 [Gemmataceae bacterium]